MVTLLDIDRTLFQFINTGFTNIFFDFLFPAITDLHKTQGFRFIFVPVLLMIVLYFLRWKGLVFALGLSISMGLADKMGSFAKHYWKRPRPFEIEQELGFEVIQRSPAGGFAFPSNHAANMFAMALFISMLYPKMRLPVFTIASLVAYSRIYNGVHYPFDVLMGGLLGAFFGILGAELTKRVTAKIERSLEMRKRASHG